MYNFARLITQINLFVRSGNIYKYKFLEYIKRYYYHAVNIDDRNTLENVEKIKEVEVYTYRQMLKFIFGNVETRDELFYRFGVKWVVELIQGGSYKRLLTKHDFISILLEEDLELANDDIEQVFAEALTAYYQRVNESEIPNKSLTLLRVK